MENTYTTLFAASGKRHFKITSGAHKVALKWLNMTGGEGGVKVVPFIFTT